MTAIVILTHLQRRRQGISCRTERTYVAATGKTATRTLQRNGLTMTSTATRTKRYAIVGTGGRAWNFIRPIIDDYKDHCALVGLCDVNRGRLDYHNDRLAAEGHETLPTFEVDPRNIDDISAFDQMVEQTRPDVVIVTTVDGYHDRYIIRAMELGCDVVTEKPMTIDDAKCRAILDAQQRTGRDCRVAFNYRFGAEASHLRKLISDGIVGDVVSVDMEYMLDVSHGADYFRRWHRDKDKSGGLLVHKATHHFDLVNWWIDAVPQRVFALGQLAFYGKDAAASRGHSYAYDRYTGNVSPDDDPFALDLASHDSMKKLYLDAEKHDGYRRDQNVFGEGISIEDSMSVLVKYRTGVQLTYSLNAFLPQEGYHVAFNGAKGRLTYSAGAAPHIITGEGSETDVKYTHECWFHPSFGKPEQVELPQRRKGGHGGADPVLHEQIFDPDAAPDPLARNAGHGQGAASILIGIAANRSIATGDPVDIADLCPQLGDTARLSELP